MYLSDCRDGRRFLAHELFNSSTENNRSAWPRKLGIVGIPAGCGHSPEDGAGVSGRIRMAKEVVGCCWGHLGTHGTSLCLLLEFAHQALGQT